MTGFLIDFSSGKKAELHLGRRVSGYDMSIQNALVLLGTSKGSDKAFPTKGTGLFSAATRGLLIDGQAAIHQAQFAAIDVLFFSREFEPATALEKIQEIRLTPSTINNDSIYLQAQFTSTLGDVRGTTIAV